MKRVALVAIFLTIILVSVLLAVFIPAPTGLAVDSRLARGRALLDAENYLDALETFRSLLKDRKEQAEAHTYLGATYIRLHLYQAAIKELGEAVKARPGQADPWFGLAHAHLELGDLKKALEEARRAVSLDDESAEAWILLGRARWFEKNYSEAEKAGLEAYERHRDNPGAVELLLRVYFDQKKNEKFESLLDRTSKPTKPIRDLAVSYFIREEQFARALDTKTRFQREEWGRSALEIELEIDRDPARTDLYPDLVRKLVGFGRFEDAIKYGRQYQGPPARVDLELAKAFWMSGRSNDAVEYFRRASEGLVHKLSAEVALATITGNIRH